MELWYPKAVRWIPPVNKQRGTRSTIDGITAHSAVGYRGGLHSVLSLPDSVRVAGWHFSPLQNGVVEQHYPLNAVLYHAGNYHANLHTVGVEHEGGYNPADEPLTEAQRAASVDLFRWIGIQGQFSLSRSVKGRTLHEHNEVSDIVTQCPSGRIPWEFYTNEQEEEMNPDYTMVYPGEWLSKVAARVGVSVEQLVYLNEIADPNKVEAFQPLRLHVGVNMPEPVSKANLDLARSQVTFALKALDIVKRELA